MIHKLMVNEITPADDDSIPTMEFSRIFKGDELDIKIHKFFEHHIKRSFENPKMKNLKFTNFSSTILSSSKSLLRLDEPRENENQETHFIRHAKILTKKLAENIHKNVTNPFLFIVLNFTFDDEELLCLIKMEKFFGVQFTDNNLLIQLDMLPDVKTDLQKCAFIYKSRIENLTEDDFTDAEITDEDNEGNDQNAFHSQILDRQDESVSKYFMTSFMESFVIAKDKEITKLAAKHITNELAKYLNVDSQKSDIKKYLDNELQKRKGTSILTLVDDVINNSTFIDNDKIRNENTDGQNLSLTIFENMRNENSSAYQEFTSSPDFIERTVIKDTMNDGRDIRITFSKMYEEKGIVNFDASNDEIVTLTIQKSKISVNR